MGLTSKTVTIVSAAAGLAVFSQAPEFSQQYRQRIGGAVDELRTIVVDFDEDASDAKLSREEALDQMTSSGEVLTKERGMSMTKTIGRYERLNEQQVWLENSHPFTRPLLVLKNLDRPLLQNTWEAYEPSVPLTSSGAVFGGIGAFLAILLARLGIGGARRVGQGGRDRHLAREIAKDQQTTRDNLNAGDPKHTGHHSEPASNGASENDGGKDEQNSDYARRLAQTSGNSRGVPSSMQVAPVGKEQVPYYKLNSEE